MSGKLVEKPYIKRGVWYPCRQANPHISHFLEKA